MSTIPMAFIQEEVMYNSGKETQSCWRKTEEQTKFYKFIKDSD